MGAAAMVDELTKRARAMRLEPTPAEKAMWRVLRQRQVDGMKFRRQAPIGLHYIADFACFDPTVIIVDHRPMLSQNSSAIV